MISEKAVVLKKERLAEGIYGVWLKTAAANEARSGQFVMLNTGSEAHLLGRPISICDIDRDRGSLRLVWRVAGYGTEELSRRKEGDGIDFIGPLGNGFYIAGASDIENIAVMGGGIGAPPLLGLVKALNRSGAKNIDVFLGYRSASPGLFLAEEFKGFAAVHIATEDGSEGTHGTVIDALNESGTSPGLIYACGPMPMLKAIKQHAEDKGISAYISLEERMACGVGACLGCVVKTKDRDSHSQVKNARICTEGPVFAAKDVDI